MHRGECERISALDVQRNAGKAVFGGGLLLCSRAAAERAVAERAVAERAAAHVWELSPRELAVIEYIDKRCGDVSRVDT